MKTSIAPIASVHYFPAGLLTYVTAFASDDGELYIVDHRAQLATHDRVQLSNERHGVSVLGYRVSDRAGVWLDLAAGAGYFPFDPEIGREVEVSIRVAGKAQPSRRQLEVERDAVRTLTLGL